MTQVLGVETELLLNLDQDSKYFMTPSGYSS